jgi:rhomboid family GlyGly-CTERM serine protease
MSDELPRTRYPFLSHRAWWFLGLAIALLVLLSLGGERARVALAYDRALILAGEYWRLLTGHLVHGTFFHLLINAAGLVLVTVLFPRDYSLWGWAIIVMTAVAAIDLGFVFYEPQLLWYVGLSGVLHGALAAGALALWRNDSRRLALVVTGVFTAKLVWEQLAGPLPFSSDIPVIVDAHLYGAIGGTVAGLGLWLLDQPSRRLPASL